MTVCPQCGAQNLPGMAYCEHCGSPLSVPEQAAVSVAPAGDPSADAAIAQAQAVLDQLNQPEHVVATPEPVAKAEPNQEPSEPEPMPAPVMRDATAATLPETAPPLDTQASPPAASEVRMVIAFSNGAEFAINSDITNIGRSDVAQNWHPELDLIPFGGGAPDLGVSRHQALIQRGNGGFALVDVGSTNGTFVNGKALEYNKPVDLHDGDIVAFGAFTTKVSIR